MGSIRHIFTAPARKAAMHAVRDVAAITDGGLDGDRYAQARNRKDPGQQVTLISLCEPCSTWARHTHPEVVRFFVHRGGLNARIVSGGTIAVGSAVVTDEED